MAAHTCLCALILFSLLTHGGFDSGSEYTNYIYAGPKDMGNDSNWHQFFDICIVNSTYEVERRHTSDGELCTIVIVLLRLSFYC